MGVDKEIVIHITADGQSAIVASEGVSESMRKMGSDIDKHSAIGIAGARGLEVVASDLGRQFGVTGEAASVLGRVVGAAADSLGKASMIMGAIMIAGYGAQMIYNRVAESNRKLAEEAEKAAVAKTKLRDETIKAGEAANDWLQKADTTIVKTREMVVAEWELYQAEYALNQERLKKGIAEQDQKVLDIKNQSVIVTRGGVLETRLLTDEEQKSLAVEEKRLAVITRQWTARDQKGPTWKGFIGADTVNKQQEQQNRVEDMMAQFRQRAESAGLKGSARELAQLDAKHAAELQKLLDAGAQREQIEEAQRIQRAEKKDLEGQQDLARQQAYLSITEQVENARLEVIGNALNAYAAATDKNAKLIFYAQQALAIAQIYVETGRAAMAAAAAAAPLGPVAAASAAASMWKLGFANMAIVTATSLYGGKSAGSSSGSTSDSGSGSSSSDSGSSSSSSSESSGYQYWYEQDPDNPYSYGSGWRPGEGQDASGSGSSESSGAGSKGDIIIYGDVYGYDDFKSKVAGAVAEDYGDRGTTYEAVNG